MISRIGAISRLGHPCICHIVVFLQACSLLPSLHQWWWLLRGIMRGCSVPSPSLAGTPITASWPAIQSPHIPAILLFPVPAPSFVRSLLLPSLCSACAALQTNYCSSWLPAASLDDSTEEVLLLWDPPLVFLGVLGCLASSDFPPPAFVAAKFMSSCFFPLYACFCVSRLPHGLL